MSQPAQIAIPGGGTLRISYRGTYAEPSAVTPRVRVEFEFSNNIPAGQGGSNLRVTVSNIDFSVRSKDGGQVHYLSKGVAQQPIVILAPNSQLPIQVYLEVGPRELHGIEKVRGDGDLNLIVYFRVFVEQHGNPQSGQPYDAPVIFPVAKSDWVEKIILQLAFKDVSLIEIPRLPGAPNFTDAVRHVDEAWRRLAMGEYGNVLLECRKSLEALSERLRQQGYEITEEDPVSKEKKKNVDWKKVFDDKEAADFVGTIFKKVWGFASPSSHTGSSIDRKEADFALMTSHAIVNIVARKLTQS